MKLEIDNISCGYGRKPILEGISATVESGEICCILGENGVGKSTLYRAILGLLPLTSGKICINDCSIDKLSRKQMAKNVSYVSQSHTPSFDYLVEEVIMMGRTASYGFMDGPSQEDKDIVNETVEMMGITYLLGKPYTEISGGERQMVMICRALAQKSEMIILDEPTANLDYGNQVKLLNVIGKLASSGLGVVFTSHNPEHALLLNAKTLILMRDGTSAFGIANETVTNENLDNAYGEDIRIVNIVDTSGKPVKICLPKLDYEM